MKLVIHPKLEELREKLQSEIDATIKERKDLGLSIPEEFIVSIGFYHTKGAIASTIYRKPDSYILINALNMARDFLKGEAYAAAVEVLKFFDLAREITSQTSETDILNIMDDPEKLFSIFESNFADKKAFEEYKEYFRKRGNEYEDFKKYLIESAPACKENLDRLIPLIVKTFDHLDPAILRHEIDHVAFFNSKIYRAKRDVLKELAEAEHEFQKKNTKETSMNCALMKEKDWNAQSKIVPLIEARGRFFNLIKPGEWDKADYEDIKGKIIAELIWYYVENRYPETMIDAIVALSWGRGEMDKETSNYVFFSLFQRLGDQVSALRYKVRPKEVNFKLATRIMYEELPAWKKKCIENIFVAVDAMAKAFKEDPSRFAKAAEAATFDEYVSICNGENGTEKQD